jgi:tetratricopeptide (TPR) repeat protein
LLLSTQARAEEDARALWDRATAQYALGKFAEAAENFERCFELKPDPAILYNAAQARRLSNNKPRALELYQSYLRVFGNKIDNRAEVQRHIDQLKAAIAKDQQVASAPPIVTKPPAPIEKPSAPPPVATRPPPPAPKPPPPAPKPVEPAKPPVVETKPAVVETKPAVVETKPAVVMTAPPPRSDKPLIKKGWFWGVVVGAAAVVATGVALGVVFGTPDPTNPNPTFGTVQGN